MLSKGMPEGESRMKSLKALSWVATCVAVLGGSTMCHAGNWLSGTYLDPALQRPDLFPRVTHNQIPEHRAVYNRPRFVPGYIAYKIEPSSQEAMAWQTNYCNGNYANHAGPYVPHYYYLKPWEALNTRARPDLPKTPVQP